MFNEVELKFTVDPGSAPGVARLLLLQGLVAERPTSRTLRSIYFDTSGADLRRSNRTLRLRRAGREWTQTLKEDVVRWGGLHVRAESEHPVARGGLDLGKINDRRFRKQLARWQAAGELLPRFETVVRRTTWRLNVTDGAVVECALDRGEVHTTDRRRRTPLCELELELKSGSPSALFALARDLARWLPLAPEVRSKAERGYVLWRRESPTKPSVAGPLALHNRVTAAEAMSKIVGNGLTHLHGNWEAARASTHYDPEHIHQMRVASRRLRTAFTVFGQVDRELKAHPVVAELRWLGGLLGEARNWDILLAETFPKSLATFPDEPALTALLRQATIRRRRTRAALGRALYSARYLALVLNLSEFVIAVRERPALSVAVAPVAAMMLTRRHKQLRKRARHLLDLSMTERHALRIAAKKMRYAAEFFGSLFKGATLDRFRRRFGQLQKVLGALNDLATTRGLLSELDAGADGDSQRALGLCVGWSAGVEEGSLTELARCWKAVARAPRFWPDADEELDRARAPTATAASH